MSARDANPLADPNKRQAQTQLVHGGTQRSQFGETSEAIFMNSGFIYEDSAAADAAVQGRTAGAHLFALFQPHRRHVPKAHGGAGGRRGRARHGQRHGGCDNRA